MHILTSYETEKSYSDSILAYRRGKYYEGAAGNTGALQKVYIASSFTVQQS